MIKQKSVIVTSEGRYDFYTYGKEIELREMIVEHYKEIFGGNTHYFNIERLIKDKFGVGTRPDGYAIDFEKKKLYVIEIELIRHRMRHIKHQIRDFIDALNHEETHKKLVVMFQEELSSIKGIGKEEIESIINNREIVIIIDDFGNSEEERNKLFELVNDLNDKEKVRVIPFQTYIRGDIYSQDHVHSFKAFTKEGLKKEAKKWNFKWGTVPVEKHLDKLNNDSKKIFRELGERICCIAPENIREVHRKNWATYQISKLGNFCTVKFPKGCLEIYMKIDKGKFKDEKNIAKNIRRTPAWTFDKVFTIKSREDIDYAISLIEQAYQFMYESKK